MSTVELKTDPFAARDTFKTGSGTAGIYRLSKLEDAGLGNIAALPYSIRVLLESLLRNCDGYEVTEDDVQGARRLERRRAGAGRDPVQAGPRRAAGFHRRAVRRRSGRDARRDAAARRRSEEDQSARAGRSGDRPLGAGRLLQLGRRARPQHRHGIPRNRERYEFLRWGQKAFNNFRVVPPGTGIVHQVNLEYLAKVVFLGKDHAGPVAFPDSLVGTDSHTTMINGLGVVGWGVGGIEAEGVMLGQPIYMLLPEVVGMELTGKLAARRDRDRPRAHRHADAPQGKSRRQVRRVLRAGRVDDVARRPGDDRQHGARIRRDDGLLPRRRPDAPLPPPDRPHEGRSRSRRALHQGARPVPHRQRARSDVHEGRAARSVDGRAEPRRAEAAAGSRAARRT